MALHEIWIYSFPLIFSRKVDVLLNLRKERKIVKCVLKLLRRHFLCLQIQAKILPLLKVMKCSLFLQILYRSEFSWVKSFTSVLFICELDFDDQNLSKHNKILKKKMPFTDWDFSFLFFQNRMSYSLPIQWYETKAFAGSDSWRNKFPTIKHCGRSLLRLILCHSTIYSQWTS